MLLAGRPISSLSFLTVSLLDVAARRAYPLHAAQRLPMVENRRPGRSKGSKDHAKVAPVLAVTLRIVPLDWHRYGDSVSEYLSALTF